MNINPSFPEARAPTADEIVAVARALQPALRQRAAACEAARRVPDETIRDLLAAGLFNIVKPRRYGGYEMGWDVFCEAIMAVAAACGSTGWVYSVVGGHAAIVSRFGTTFLDEMWGANPEALMSSCRRTEGELEPVPGGYRGSAMGQFSSGCEHADFVIIDAVPVRGEKQAIMIAVPTAEIEILDTWKVFGLCGTGSNDVRFTDLFIPEHRTWFPGKKPDGEAIDGPLFRTPHHLGGPFGLSTPLLGMAMGGLEAFITLTGPRRNRDGIRLAEAEHVQMRVAESAVEIDAALALVRLRLAQWMAHVRGEAAGSPAPATALPMAGDVLASDLIVSSFVVKSAHSALDRLIQVAGAHQIQLGAPFQRAFRDVLAGMQQPSNNWDFGRIMGGRALLNRPPATGAASR